MRFLADLRRRHLRSLLALVVVAASVGAGMSSHAGAVVVPAQLGRIRVAPGPQPGSYALEWASADQTAGDVYDVQVKYSSATTWTDLVSGTTDLGQTFTPSVAGPYSLRARLRNDSTSFISGWSEILTLVGNWSMFQFNQRHLGFTSDPTIGASRAPGLTVKWKTLVTSTGKMYSSPVVAFNVQLHKPLAYAASAAGAITAFDLATGAVIWTRTGNGAVLATPAVDGNTVYVGTEGDRVLALDAATGQTQCRFSLSGAVISSPTVGHVDNTGPVVFFGDVGQSEELNAGHEWAVNGVGNSRGACTLKWVFNGWNNTGTSGSQTGSWSPPALVTDSTGRPLLVFGSANPDDSVYALDARSGTKVWRFQTAITNPDADVGAAPTIGRPGLNGFPHGVVYIDGKDRLEYALDLLTGAPIWQYNLALGSGVCCDNAQTTAILVDNKLVIAYAGYVFALNATTGASIWRSAPAAGIYFSSPTMSGAAGDRVIFIGDSAGVEHAYRGDGSQVFQLKTGASIVSSAALGYGSVLFDSSNGYLYALGSSPAPPFAPLNVSAVPGNGAATVHWMTPASDNFSAITGYTVSAYVGATLIKTVPVGIVNQATITGLTDRTTYTFKVAAKNTNGTGPQAAAPPVIVGAPIAPTNVSAVPGNNAATVHWMTPASNNGSAITGYTVSAYAGATLIKTVPVGIVNQATITGLTNGTTYTFKVAAKNIRGTGPKSLPSLPITVGAPTAPTAVMAVNLASGQLSVSFAAGANNGSTITNFAVTCTSTDGGVTGTQAGTASPITVTGLTATKTYTCTATATNARGTGPASAPSPAIVKYGPLDHLVVSPGSATISAGDSQAYAAEGFDQYNNDLGDMTAASTFTISPDGSCTGSTCTATIAGAHTVTATDGTATGTATLTIS